MRIFLVRHGESEGNVDKTAYQTIADHAIQLTDKGREQAREAGAALKNYLVTDGYEGPGAPTPTFRVWVSPYTRARQTADEFIEALSSIYVHDRHEHLLLAEQQFGALNDHAGEGEVPEHIGHIKRDFKRAKSHGGRIFARPWGGESRFDVCVRVHQAFGTFIRDKDRHNIEDLIIVAHGTTLRAFTMMWLNKPYEWFEAERNPPNGSIRLIVDDEDRGYIWKQAKPPRTLK
ncbi:histidine phosphatase family protein [Deltaproteobacteria bacterium]|nr:histidine phosphatase family protein [Deltaproteobacteria bacterium]